MTFFLFFLFPLTIFLQRHGPEDGNHVFLAFLALHCIPSYENRVLDRQVLLQKYLSNVSSVLNTHYIFRYFLSFPLCTCMCGSNYNLLNDFCWCFVIHNAMCNSFNILVSGTLLSCLWWIRLKIFYFHWYMVVVHNDYIHRGDYYTYIIHLNFFTSSRVVFLHSVFSVNGSPILSGQAINYNPFQFTSLYVTTHTQLLRSTIILTF